MAKTALLAALALCCSTALAAQEAPAWHDQGDASASNSVSLLAGKPLRHEAGSDYHVTSYREIDGLAPGSYTLHAHVNGSGGQPSCFVFARADGYTLARTALSPAAGAQEITVTAVPVQDGHLVVGLHSDAKAGQWAEISEVRVERDQTASSFLAGGDVSLLPLMEEHGAHYFDRAGKQRDALELLRDSGFRIVRLRLYEAPGSGHGNEGYYWPEGSMDLKDLLALAQRSARLGLQIELTFHYSDFWTNSSTQNLPAAWAEQLRALPDETQRFARLRTLVFEHTRDVVQAMREQGTPPQFVSIGNEIEGGLLYPYGHAADGNWEHLAQLLEAGYEGVKAANAESQVILHLDGAGDLPKYRNYFDHIKAAGTHWDVIGMSYYPFWTKKTVEQVAEFNRALVQQYGTDLMVMEVGFNWRATLPGGSAGQLSDNGPYPMEMSTPDGQRKFMAELVSSLKATPRMRGLLYWDPIMIATPGVGWALRESDGKPAGNLVANTTLFDFTGHALPALDVFRDNAAAMPAPAQSKDKTK